MECQICSNERPSFLEPCPRCGNTTTFGSHQERGMDVCHGCQEKFCTDCKFNCRYTCNFLRAQYGEDYMPPPPRLERQLTEYKWEIAEDFMRQNPELREHTIYRTQTDLYKVIRRNGYLIRKHGTECCGRCGNVDIRYPEHRMVYDMVGFICKKCISQG
jgi:hypothetical protein